MSGLVRVLRGLGEVWLLVATLLALAAGVMSVQASRDANDAVERIQREETREDGERRERLQQTCTRDERRFAAEVRSLRQTYEYFLRLSPARRKTDDIASVIDLDQVERETRDESPLPFCEVKGVGLPEKGERGGSEETDPEIPKRPEELRPR